MNSGLLLVNKAEGMTSHDVVARCRRLLGRKDIGHAGTLDPMATGLLVLLVGKATKLSDYILNGDKAYRAKVLVGTETDSDDITGEVTRKIEDLQISQEEVEKLARQMTGTLELKVPIYSAIKVNGKKLYTKARQGEDFEPPTRMMEFHDLEILSFDGQTLEVEFACSKGSYVRAWAKTLGEKLGCGATLSGLIRTKSQPYSLEKSIDLDDLEGLAQQGLESSSGWVPLSQTLPDWPGVRVDGMDEKLVRNGQIPRKLERFLELEYGSMKDLLGIKLLSRRNKDLVALLEPKAPMGFKIRRVFPNQ